MSRASLVRLPGWRVFAQIEQRLQGGKIKLADSVHESTTKDRLHPNMSPNVETRPGGNV